MSLSKAITKSDKKDLTSGSSLKKIILFTLPLLGSSLIQQLYNSVDIFFAGNFINEGNAMAAVGASGMIVTLLVGFWTGMSVGCGVVISQAFGEKNHDKLSKAVHTSVAVALIGGILISVLGFFISPTVLRWMQTPQDIYDMSCTYIKVYFLSVLSLVVYNICSAILRAAGDSKNPLIYQCIGGVCNVVGNYIFIIAFDMGVLGIAISTLFSQTIPAILIFLHLCLTKKPYRIIVRKIRINKAILGNVIKIGVPTGVQSMVLTLSNIVVQSQINGLGTDTIGAFTVYFKVELIMYLPIVAVGQATTTFVGQNVGAGKYNRLRRGMKECLAVGLATSAITSGFVLLLCPLCFSFFGATPEEISLGCHIMYINASLYFMFNFIEVFAGALRGSGNSMAPMIILIINMCGVRVAALMILVNLFHSVQSVAVCYPITWFTTSACLIVYYFFSKLYKEIKAHKNKSDIILEETLA